MWSELRWRAYGWKGKHHEPCAAGHDVESSRKKTLLQLAVTYQIGVSAVCGMSKKVWHNSDFKIQFDPRKTVVSNYETTGMYSNEEKHIIRVRNFGCTETMQ